MILSVSGMCGGGVGRKGGKPSKKVVGEKGGEK